MDTAVVDLVEFEWHSEDKIGKSAGFDFRLVDKPVELIDFDFQ